MAKARKSGANLKRELPRIPFAELFECLQSAHVLLALVSDHMLYSTPYKVYDYMAAGRPILGVAPRDAALHGLLTESGAGLGVEPEDEGRIEAALEALLYPAGGGQSPRTGRFHWSNLALQYHAALETVATEHLESRAAGPGTSSRTAPAER